MSYIRNGISNETPKEAWDKLKEEFQGSDKTRQQQLITLIRDFENLNMKKAEIVKQYTDRIMTVVNNIGLLGEEFADSRVIEKVITIFPEMYESKISSLEYLSDLSTIFFFELINALYVQEERRASIREEHTKEALRALSIDGANL
ncbi:pleiotropic drug resistance protein 3-like [Gossypium australe]|uniref:Pleiotropic drug resistance protein 3-like n=1 Tax=Gossypium australe TaxID=47621 RepID=A0A5B6VKE8_9ROSI|nr:pleiotropic drug resistance protein 3-like [Gossypium australe]